MRQSRARLVDIVMAIKAIDDHMTRGDLRDGLVFDAVRVRLIEITLLTATSTPTTPSSRRPSTATYQCSSRQSDA